MREGLHIEQLATRSCGRAVLRGIDLELAPGDFMLLLGPNGAGKTTLLRCLLGLTRYSGSLRVDVGGAATGRRADFAPVLDRTSLHPGWSVRANVDYQLNDSKGHRRPLVQELIPSAILRSAAGRLSTGQRKTVMLAIALAGDAPVLLLDEFANGLDLAGRQQLRTGLRRACADGRIVLATGHDLSAFEGLPSRVAELVDGRLVDVTEAHPSLRRAEGR
ncbi:ABC-2 type transport system ATP-binding protein/iron complex transport system ATP-binding protein [Rathayibacter sp. PhB93]|uniref:ATP-binding cassette domain-containing protein n=1 Tax=unclassified Rathayibacter TaxID=2609250 RepID=UPI000F471EE4|nr:MULTISPECIES: ATP-binding cassette domain-containing protein [unclassified Rathayibacter]ROQ04475.1 ABC-2 type transport system ATP-binding protein/iron complex transport system ATP-binding protein [Rathayibacter sp. PhB93]TDQ13313.1 ABC-2 type transport system ATP-binding protein/iron complex transport system ATP-binding protein [Rathayibacter sp. PhB1]